MRSIPLYLSMVLLTLCVGSCASTPVSLREGGIESATSIVEGLPGPGEIGVVDAKDLPEMPLAIPGFWKSNALYVMLDTLGLQDKLSPSAKRAFMDALFSSLPDETSEGLLREVLVGGIFGGGEPLRIRIVRADPGPKAPEEATGVFILATDALPTFKAGKFTGFRRNEFEDADIAKNVAFAFVSFEDGRFVDATYVLTKDGVEEKVAKGGEGLPGDIARVDIYLLDQDPSNDGEIPTILAPYLSDDSLPAMDRALVLANMFQYGLLKGDSAAARKALDEAASLPLEEGSLKDYILRWAPLLFELSE